MILRTSQITIRIQLRGSILLLLGLCWTSSTATDFRYISYDDLLPNIDRFSKMGVVSFSQLLFDIPRYQLLVGSRDYLFRLSLEGLQKLEEAHWPSQQTTINLCKQKGQLQDDCRNYVRVLLSLNGKVFTCGTNAFSPKCTWREIDNLNAVTQDISGVARCPFSPHQNLTSLMTSNGDFYIASAVDFSARDPAIYRISDSTPILRTVQYNHKWLSEPNFVGSYEIGNFTYFFFRETAVENINCGKTVFSRVARACKNDVGGQYMLKDNWTTFLKARLNCSIPGEFPFYYNEIQSVFFLEQENLLYATFTTPLNSIYGSAVCAFNMTSINHSFKGPFKYQGSPSSAWERHSGHHGARHHFQCDSPGSTKHLLDSEKYQLMDEPVQAVTLNPFVTEELQRFTHIVVDVVSTQHHEGIHVLFVATVEGTIKKFMVLPRTQQTCLLEVLRLFPGNHSQPIKTMKILQDTSSLYIGTDTSVMRITVERCVRFKSKRACLNAMDPYCGWNAHLQACTVAPQRNPLSSHWQQSFPTCPHLTEPVDGQWSPWDNWFECRHIGDSSLDGRCLCRTRKCNNPSPAHGGKECEGPTFQVSNCTRNGQWTEWSAWSACSQTCGLAIKTRRRTCGNPEPAYGGRTCVGPDRDEIYCTSNPPCPAPTVPSIHGRWSDWRHWEECSAPCGGGFRIRKRKCDNPAPQNNGRECSGCDTEYQECNKHLCPEAKKATPWTPWLRANATKDGFYEQRFRFSCKVNLPDSKMIRISSPKKEERFCVDGHSCLSSEFINNDGDWSEWSSWSDCSVECGRGIQYRTRQCDNPRPSGSGSDCDGQPRMERVCNSHPCSGMYSDWSSWSACSVTCGNGTKFRARKCLNTNHLQDPDGQTDNECTLSQLQETVPCGEEREDTEGWEEWAVWSLCDQQDYQHRRRQCRIFEAGSIKCQGSDRQTRMCVNEKSNDLNVQPQLDSSSSGITLGHLVGACIGCFIAGAILTGIGCYYCCVYRKKRRKRLPSSKLFNSSSTAHPNLYVPPAECLNKNNYSGTLSKKGIPLKEATIKRNGRSSGFDEERFS